MWKRSTFHDLFRWTFHASISVNDSSLSTLRVCATGIVIRLYLTLITLNCCSAVFVHYCVLLAKVGLLVFQLTSTWQINYVIAFEKFSVFHF